MELKTPQQQIELFHLLFLRHLGDRIDKSHYALKGGCNLRFYFKSIRYSEDIDLDVRTIARATLQNQVTKLLESQSFQQVLQTRKLSIIDINPVKQTDTTQRWKMKIRGPVTSLAVPTKIEFSRRGMKNGIEFTPVESEIISTYELYPILSNHYSLNAALTQKIEALLNRTQTQARDVFDLHHLLEATAKLDKIPKDLKGQLGQAIENLISISFDDYKSQVVSYLNPEYQKYFGTHAKWNAIQERLVESFESAGERRKK